jgi:hypothetical protein
MTGKNLGLYSALILFLFVSMRLTAQTDTLYVESYYNNLMPRLLTNYKVQSASFVTKSDTSFSADYFSTGGQYSIGAEIGYKWATLGYNFGFNKDKASTNRDFRFSTSLRSFRIYLNYTSLQNLDYYRVQGIEEEKDTLFHTRQDQIDWKNVGLKVDYIVNSRKCYYASSLSHCGRQLKSQGSFIVSTAVSYQDFDLRGLSDSARTNFRQLYSSEHIKTVKADVGLGYAYNWVATKKLVIYVSDIPNIGFQQVNTSGSSSTDRRAAVSFTNYVRAGVIYTWKNRFIGAYAYNSVTAVRLTGYSFNNLYTSVQLHFGMMLGDPARSLRKRA